MPLPTTLFVDNTPELVKQAVVESEAKAETEEKAEKPGLCLKLTKPPNHLYSSNHIPYRWRWQFNWQDSWPRRPYCGHIFCGWKHNSQSWSCITKEPKKPKTADGRSYNCPKSRFGVFEIMLRRGLPCHELWSLRGFTFSFLCSGWRDAKSSIDTPIRQVGSKVAGTSFYTEPYICWTLLELTFAVECRGRGSWNLTQYLSFLQITLQT